MPASVQKGQGCLEIRELWASTQMNEWFEVDWAGMAQVFRLRRWVKDGEKEREETVYGVTNLPRKKAPAARLLSLQQAHWRIENRLHYRRDVTVGGKMHVKSVLRVRLKRWQPSMEGSSL